jgi:hypothetical protein
VRNPVVGELIALSGSTPLVRLSVLGDADVVVKARSCLDLRGTHIGSSVVVVFDHGDPALPIVIGVVGTPAGWPDPEKPAQVEVDVDGRRMLINVKEELVLRCGEASITLTKAGKVLIRGTYVLTQASGRNRVCGGSVELN